MTILDIALKAAILTLLILFMADYLPRQLAPQPAQPVIVTVPQASAPPAPPAPKPKPKRKTVHPAPQPVDCGLLGLRC